MDKKCLQSSVYIPDGQGRNWIESFKLLCDNILTGYFDITRVEICLPYELSSIFTDSKKFPIKLVFNRKNIGHNTLDFTVSIPYTHLVESFKRDPNYFYLINKNTITIKTRCLTLDISKIEKEIKKFYDYVTKFYIINIASLTMLKNDTITN